MVLHVCTPSCTPGGGGSRARPASVEHVPCEQSYYVYATAEINCLAQGPKYYLSSYTIIIYLNLIAGGLFGEYKEYNIINKEMRA